MSFPRPQADSIPTHRLRNIEHIPGTNDLWLAEATRAIKTPGKGDYMLVLLRPDTNINVHSSGMHAGGARHGHRFTGDGQYRLCGYAKIWHQRGFKVSVESPVGDDINCLWMAQHRATVFVSDFATARRLLIVLAKEIVYDR